MTLGAVLCALLAGCGPNSEDELSSDTAGSSSGTPSSPSPPTAGEAHIKPLTIDGSACPIDEAYGQELAGGPVTIRPSFEQYGSDDLSPDDNGCALRTADGNRLIDITWTQPKPRAELANRLSDGLQYQRESTGEVPGLELAEKPEWGDGAYRATFQDTNFRQVVSFPYKGRLVEIFSEADLGRREAALKAVDRVVEGLVTD